MPPEVKPLFRVATTAEDFAAEILAALQDAPGLVPDRAGARQLFGLKGLDEALSKAGTLIGVRKHDLGDPRGFADG
jgi:hypothetical protein